VDCIDTGFDFESRKISAMNKLNALAKQRAAQRLMQADVCAARIVKEAHRVGVQMSIVGSLAKNSFKAHSDIDLLVHGSAAPHRRAMVERLVAEHLRGTNLPYDLIFEADLTEERLKEMLHDIV
jgi:predicted nucleotidyltransferase